MGGAKYGKIQQKYRTKINIIRLYSQEKVNPTYSRLHAARLLRDRWGLQEWHDFSLVLALILNSQPALTNFLSG
jgi:hypothetical protein